MTLSTQTSKAAFSGNGVSTVFPLPFPFQREADIKVLLRQNGFETPLEPGAQYALSGAGSAAGGSLTLKVAPATGQTLVAYRAPAIVQEVDYVENSAFPAETHEAALDLLTMICQSLQEQIGRAVLYPVSTPAGDILDSASFLAASAASKEAARIAEQNAAASAGQAGIAAGQAIAHASAAEFLAASADGLLKVSASDAKAQTLSAKLLAGNGLAEGIESPGGVEALRLAVALAQNPGLEFASGLLRVKAGAGLVLSASGVAADAGVTAGKLVQLDANGRLPALDARNLTGLTASDQLARDNAAMNTFITYIGMDKEAAVIPSGGVYPCKSSSLLVSGGAHDAEGRYYHNGGNTPIARTAGAPIGTMTNNGGLAAAFDGVVPQPVSRCAAKTVSVSGFENCVGKDWGAGVTKTVTRFRVFGPMDASVFNGVGGALYGLQGSMDGVNWATLTAVAAFPAGCGQSVDIATGIAATAGYRYHRIVFNGDGLNPVCVSEVQFFDAASAGPVTDMTLMNGGHSVGSVPTRALVYLLHKAGDGVLLNTDIVVHVARTEGGPYAAATDLATLCAFDANYNLLRATVDLSGLPSGARVLWKVTTHNATAQRVRAVLLWLN